MRRIRPTCALCIFVVGISTALAAEDYERFIGDFRGKFTSEEGADHNRDLSVSIRGTDKGFNLSWATTTYKKNKKKTKSYSIDFVKSEREQIYQATQKRNASGAPEPLDPIKGDPYVWVRVDGNQFILYGMFMIEDGGYEMQTYDRTLLDDNVLRLKFSRVRNGETLKAVNADLYRQ